MSQHRLSGQIYFLLILALAIGSTCAPAQPRPGSSPPTAGGPDGPPGRGGPPPMAPPKPYKPVAVTLPQPYSDPSFEAFRKELGEIAGRKDRAALAGKVVARGFFWMADGGDKANKRKPGIDNLAAAIGLDNRDGAGWEILADSAEEETLEPIPDKKGVMCSPAAPVFDHKAAEQTAKGGKDTRCTPNDTGRSCDGIALVSSSRNIT